MVSTKRTSKYIGKLGIIFLFIAIIFTSCSEAGDKFNLVLKSYSDNNNSGMLIFKNLDNNKVIEKSIRTKEPIDITLDLDAKYEIKYEDSTADIFAYIKEITPSDYGFEKVYLTLNKNKSFRAMIHTISDTINDTDKYYYLNGNNSIYKAQGNNFKQLFLLRPITKIINKVFDITNNNVIGIDGNFLINQSNIAFINKSNDISIVSHNISNLKFINEKHIKLNNNENYFMIFKKDNNNYDCVSLIKEVGDNININQVNDCIDFSINDTVKILTQNQEFYLWDVDTLYKYQNSKFQEIHKFEKSGEIFNNNNNFYLVSNKEIYLINLLENTLLKLNFTSLPFETIKIFKINNNTNLITSSIWMSNENYFIFNDDNPSLTLKEYSFPDYINLKNITNIEIDENQNIFFNDSSFQISNQQFNSIRFYNFSYFK